MNKMPNNSNKCACGFEASEFASILTIINDRIGESKVYDTRLSPNVIKLYQDLVSPALNHLHKIKEFCDIDINDEDKRLKNLSNKIAQINNPEKRVELSNDVSFITDNIKKKLYDCAREK